MTVFTSIYGILFFSISGCPYRPVTPALSIFFFSQVAHPCSYLDSTLATRRKRISKITCHGAQFQCLALWLKMKWCSIDARGGSTRPISVILCTPPPRKPFLKHVSSERDIKIKRQDEWSTVLVFSRCYCNSSSDMGPLQKVRTKKIMPDRHHTGSRAAVVLW
jgi:hypothetical protein